MYVASEAIRDGEEQGVRSLRRRRPRWMLPRQSGQGNKGHSRWVKRNGWVGVGTGHDGRLEARIVVTVGEKIGKEHLTYAQGAVRELVAMGTIMAADDFGLPVSTTHGA